MSQPTPCRYDDERTDEELTDLRLQTAEATEYWGLRVLRAMGIRTIDRAGLWLAMVDKNFCPSRCPVDPEHPDVTRPRIRRHDVQCPNCNHRSNFRKTCAPAMKTPAKRKAFAAAVESNVPEDPTYTVVQTGHSYCRVGLSTDTQTALDNADATNDEPFRIVLIRARDALRAAEVVDEKGDSLPWIVGVQLRPDDTLPAGWHGGPLSLKEKALLEKQRFEDRSVRRRRREQAIRDLRREVI